MPNLIHLALYGNEEDGSSNRFGPFYTDGFPGPVTSPSDVPFLFFLLKKNGDLNARN